MCFHPRDRDDECLDGSRVVTIEGLSAAVDFCKFCEQQSARPGYLILMKCLDLMHYMLQRAAHDEDLATKGFAGTRPENINL